MTNGREITRIWGVPIRISLSAIVIAVLVVPALALQLLPDAAPGLNPTGYWIAALLGGALFAGSILAHELGHTRVAQRNGIGVQSVTLWALGGVAALDREADSPGAEARIAVAGPAMSMFVAATAGVTAFALDAVNGPAVTVAMLYWLAFVNVLLGVFNMLPAAPLDGGRVLRAALWARHGDKTRAAITASNAGRVVGAAIAAFGVVLFLEGGNGLLLALVGWFIMSSARRERDLARMQRSLAGRRVADVMRPPERVIDAWTLVDDFLGRDAPTLRKPWVVVRDVSGRQSAVVTTAAIQSLDPGDRRLTSLGWIAEPVADMKAVSPTDDAAEALMAMNPSLGGAPVVVDGELVGVVSAQDLFTAAQSPWLFASGTETTPSR